MANAKLIKDQVYRSVHNDITLYRVTATGPKKTTLLPLDLNGKSIGLSAMVMATPNARRILIQVVA
jgi:hypothetical protein